MNVNFTSQQNYNSCSFGKWKQLAINTKKPLELAYCLKKIIHSSPNSQVCFQIPGEAPIDVSKAAVFTIADICTNGKLKVFANCNVPRKHFTALKNCLRASSIEEAQKIADSVKVINLKA